MINLKQMFPTLRVTFEESLEKRGDPWMMEIRCQKGIIYPHSSELLALECKTYTAKQVLKINNIIVHQQGDSEWTLLFQLKDFDKVANIVKPRKRRILNISELERLKKWQFQKKSFHQFRPKN